MKKNCILSILNKQLVDSKKDDIKLVTLGFHGEKNGKHYIMYNEYQENSPNTTSTSILKIENSEHVTLIKSGNIQSKLILEKDKRHYCQYKTEFGVLILGIYTKNIEYNLTQNSGNIYIKYFLDINSTVTSINEIFINIKENK